MNSNAVLADLSIVNKCEWDGEIENGRRIKTPVWKLISIDTEIDSFSNYCVRLSTHTVDSHAHYQII